MKLKSTLIALAAAMGVSTGAWAACSADIDMGGNTITNIGANGSTVATQADLQAASRLEISGITSLPVDGFRGAVAFCQDLDDSGAADGTASNAGWRLPQSVNEATVTMNAHTRASVDITGRSYAGTGNAADENAMIWTADPLNYSNQIATGTWGTINNYGNGYWLTVTSNGNWSILMHDGTIAGESIPSYAVCVR